MDLPRKHWAYLIPATKRDCSYSLFSSEVLGGINESGSLFFWTARLRGRHHFKWYHILKRLTANKLARREKITALTLVNVYKFMIFADWTFPGHKKKPLWWNICYKIHFNFKKSSLSVKWATSRFGHLKKFSLNFSSSSFVIRVNLLHPKPSCSFVVYYYLFSVFLS